jgi:predicted SAM-dependent methyltransferase
VRVNLGCGLDILPGWVNVDASGQLGPSVNVWDLDDIPWEWAGDCSASEIRARDIFEHVDDPVGFMCECHRILVPGGPLRMQTTYWQWVDAFTDPTHKRFPTEQTFDYWVRGTALYEAQNAQMGGVEFVKVRVEPNPGTGQMDVVLRKPDA